MRAVSSQTRDEDAGTSSCVSSQTRDEDAGTSSCVSSQTRDEDAGTSSCVSSQTRDEDAGTSSCVSSQTRDEDAGSSLSVASQTRGEDAGYSPPRPSSLTSTPTNSFAMCQEDGSAVGEVTWPEDVSLKTDDSFSVSRLLDKTSYIIDSPVGTTPKGILVTPLSESTNSFHTAASGNSSQDECMSSQSFYTADTSQPAAGAGTASQVVTTSALPSTSSSKLTQTTSMCAWGSTTSSHIGMYSIVAGTYSLAAGTSSLPTGASSLPAGTSSLPAGTSSLPAGASSIPAGTSSLPAGASSLPAGASSIPAGTSSLPAGTSSIPAGTYSLAAGTSSIPAGTYSLAAGTSVPAYPVELGITTITSQYLHLLTVKNFAHLCNKCVRVVGTVKRTDAGEWFVSIREHPRTHNIRLDLSLLDVDPPQDRRLQLVGELALRQEGHLLVLTVLFHRDFEMVDIDEYEGAVQNLHEVIRLPLLQRTGRD